MKYDMDYKFSDFTNLISRNGPKYVINGLDKNPW